MGLGTDFALLDDFPAGFELVTGRRNLAYACARRLDTERGSLIRDPNYGTNMRDEINAESDPNDLRRIESKVRAELLKDERVEDVEVIAEYNFGLQALSLSITIEDAEGPFTFVLSISTLTIELLFEGDTPVVVAATATAATPVVAIPGDQGPPGPPGAPGASGGFTGWELALDDDSEHYVVGTTETILGNAWLADLTGAPADLTAALWMSAMVNAGTGTVKLRIGGSESGIDGTVVATASVTATAFAAKTASAPYANPGGQVWVKVTAIAASASDVIYVRRPAVVLKD